MLELVELEPLGNGDTSIGETIPFAFVEFWLPFGGYSASYSILPLVCG